MRTKKVNTPRNQSHLKKKRVRKTRGSGKKNKVIDLTNSPLKRNAGRKTQLKRLNNNNITNSRKNANYLQPRVQQGRYFGHISTPLSSKTARGPEFKNYDQCLNDYRNLRRRGQVSNQSPAEPGTSTSAIVIDDDSDYELEEGEIREENACKTDSVERLIRESKDAVQRSRNLRRQSTSGTNAGGNGGQMMVFYEDKNLEEMKVCKTPIYNTRSSQTKDESSNGAQEAVCLDTTSPDDSLIFISENKPVLQRPSFLSTPAIDRLYSKIPVVKTPSPIQRNQDSASRKRRVTRTKVYMAKKKLARLQSPPINVPEPTTSSATALVSFPQPSTSTNGTAVSKLPPPPPTFAAVTAADFILLPSSSPKGPASKTVAAASTASNNAATAAAPSKPKEKRIILIDGSNVALGFSEARKGKLSERNDRDFSAEGLKIAIDHFKQMGFEKVKAVVPEYRIRRSKSSNYELMNAMKNGGQLLLTPAKAYDDLMLLQSALKLNAAIVSNDFFRDIRFKHKEYVEVVDKRQIRYNWVFEELMLVEDPYGRQGPTLNEILYK